ncbi:MAG: hypothetical protein WGN25_04515 [Candidatus Electrothrix sp. GW3-4]|uniref:hypothetical protein n=1 Tax=Candidatus Electrothrix sp. GW3-4 TaxID=3126740 RepID=UPI0030D58952
MGKEQSDKAKKKCCRKYQKKSTYCKRCPIKIRLQCQLERRVAEMSKKKDDKKKEEKKAAKKAAKKVEKRHAAKNHARKSQRRRAVRKKTQKRRAIRRKKRNKPSIPLRACPFSGAGFFFGPFFSSEKSLFPVLNKLQGGVP